MAADWSQAIIYTFMPWLVLIRELPWVQIIVQLLMVWLAVVIFHRVGTNILARLAAPFPFSRRLVRYGHRAGALVVFLLASQIVLRGAPDLLPGIDTLRHMNALGTIGALTWLGVRCVKAIADTIIELNPVHAPDNLQARRIQTQTKVMARSVTVLIILVGSGLALMTLPLFRQVGTSLLASAGVAGIVVGFAAKPILGNLLAGMQLAITQPIRLEDVVIVENEWGWIEEITGTYVVVRIWDQRRMIVPLQWFIEHPFQNWTRRTSDILGTVFVWADYRLPLSPVRKEAERICRNSPDWDGRVCLIEVTEASDRAMQMRVLVSALDSPRAWNLRCQVREGLIHFIQREYPEYLPRVRAEVGKDMGGGIGTQDANNEQAGWNQLPVDANADSQNPVKPHQ
jgi:small-conductance mechanosensitive channel